MKMKRTGLKRQKDREYVTLFSKPPEHLKLANIVVYGDHGTGKSTLAKKIAYDWATNQFKVFPIVFYVNANLIDLKKSDSVEKVVMNDIIQASPSLPSEKVVNIFEKLRHMSLFILDTCCILPLRFLEMLQAKPFPVLLTADVQPVLDEVELFIMCQMVCFRQKMWEN